jgi:dihydrodipicolinate synthase/N-acetylneuraminate lyase
VSDRTPDGALAGVIPILIMPFTANGDIDESALRREVDWAVRCGVDGLGLALASEMPRLSESERAEVVRVTVEQIAGRVPLVVHAGAESAALSIRLAADAARLGAHALMIPPPTFEVGDREDVIDFYREVGGAVDLQLVLQDIPQARVRPELALELADLFPGRIALKIETPPTPVGVREAVEAVAGRGIAVFGGAGGLLLHSEMIRGARGTMPGCALPDCFVDVWRAHRAGDRAAARRTFARLVPLLSVLTMPGRVMQMHREVLRLRGVFDTADLRAPAARLTRTDVQEVAELLSDLGLVGR